MGEFANLTRALLAGALIGAVFYGGLWWTVGHSASKRHLGAWLLGSFLLRTTVALGGFYFVAQFDWRTLLTCLFGFFTARLCVTRLTRTSIDRKPPSIQGFRP